MKHFIRNMMGLKIINLVFLLIAGLTVESAISGPLSYEYELVYFYSHSCKHCQIFTPILVEYAENNQLNIAGFLLGGITSNRSIAYVPGSLEADQEIMEKFFNNGIGVGVPALFLINKRTLHTYPISQGALTYQELDIRVKNLRSQIMRPISLQQRNGNGI